MESLPVHHSGGLVAALLVVTSTLAACASPDPAGGLPDYCARHRCGGPGGRRGLPPTLGLGDDLSTDFRSWIVAHGEQVHAAVLADPALLAELPDASPGL